MVKPTFIGTPQSRVATEPVRPGSLIFTDEHRLYWDSPEAKRYEIADILELESEVARQAITKPLNKFYYVLSTNTLYRYNNGWKDLSSSSGSGGGGGGTGPIEPFELTLDKLIPFASNRVPKPIDATGKPGNAGVAGEYARSDHTHELDLTDMAFDCGYFPGATPPTEISIHNVSPHAHPFLIVDGNVSTPPRTDYPELAAHLTDVYAHCDMIFDGNDADGELTDESLPAHSLNRHAHRNLRLDGGNLLAN